MSNLRIYCSSKLQLERETILDPRASHHILNVMRLGIGAKITLFDGQGGEFSVKILANQPNPDKQKCVLVLPTEFFACTEKDSRESPLKIHLGQAIARGEKMDFIIQKATELGATSITPLMSEHCNVKLTNDRLENRLQHWQSVAIHAAEQSGRCHVPQINSPKTLKTWITNTQNIPCEIKLLLFPETHTTLTITLAQRSEHKEHPTQIALLVGPEGGLSKEENAFAQQHGFCAIKLGPRILRTETAALVAISALQFLWGDLC
jgi:16S rRNA (uracil1498-N3)-methyltransferase